MFSARLRTALRTAVEAYREPEYFWRRKVLADAPSVAPGDPAFPEMLPIIRGDGSIVTDFSGATSWKAMREGQDKIGSEDAKPISAISLLTETHHRAYGRPWVLGRYYVDQLVAFGVRPSDRVLDFGCGAGRVGIWLIPYLDEGCYHGLDHHARSLVAFAAYENFLHRLWPRRPRLMLTDAFEAAGFGAAFDTVLDFHTTIHLTPEKRDIAFRNIAAACVPGARLFMLHAPELGTEGMRAVGFELADRQRVTYPMLSAYADANLREDDWHLFRRV